MGQTGEVLVNSRVLCTTNKLRVTSLRVRCGGMDRMCVCVCVCVCV